MKVVIIGGGASGLVAAIYAARSNNEVVLIEKNNVCGKKLSITGNGRCNYFNSEMDISHYYSNDAYALKNIINDENVNEILSLFEKIGIVPKIKNGYYYPMSNKASSVRDALVCEMLLENVEIVNDAVKSVLKKEDKFTIKLENNNDILADKVILALGSCAYPKTGSDGLGYEITKSFGHKIIKPLPALVPLVCDGNYFSLWSGARCDAKVSLFEDGIALKEEFGEIQFTNYGISGICVFNLSSLVSKGLDLEKKEEIVINFVPWMGANSVSDVLDCLEKREDYVSGRNLVQFLSGFLEEKIINVILKVADVNSNKYYSELSNKEKHRLAQCLFAFRLKVVGTKSFENAQVC
ncbi:MAG: aminoacetone oxidase family FAD-binding enzyme [Bacilli bacterium]|nr:aminoacetone oxidase family FAD-binding enzyme [Bacilli bacterium]